MISVIVVSYNTCSLLRQSLESLFDYSANYELEVFVVDNDSKDDSADMVQAEFPKVHLTRNQENLGFAAANNQAWEQCNGDYVLLLNPDAFLTPGALANAMEFMEGHPDCGICGGRLVKPDGSLDPSARKFPTSLSKFFTISGLKSRFPASSFFSGHEFGQCDHMSTLEVDWIPGTFTLYRRTMLEQTGLFDERFYIYYEETDLCKTARRHGWKVYYLPTAKVIHVGGASSKTRKDTTFDKHALQVVKFRMRSEWLYFRKNSGLAAVCCNAGVEVIWHSLRWLVNLLPGRPDRENKRSVSAHFIRQVVCSINDTNWGLSAPPRPW
jgi:GT2 family glycosyltransferase